MSPFCFFLELWTCVRNPSPLDPRPWGQTSLLLMDGRFWGGWHHFARRITFEVFLRMPQGAHFGVALEIKSGGPFRRWFRGSFWSSFGASKVSRKVVRRRHTESQKIRIPTWKASVARFSGFNTDCDISGCPSRETVARAFLSWDVIVLF